MAGFDNEVVFALGERLQASTAQAIMLMQQTATDVSSVNFTGDPNGSVAANPSSLSHDPSSGDVWVKATGTGNTGWVLLSSGPSQVTLHADDTNTLVGDDFNLFGQKAGTIPVMDTLVAGGNFLFENRTWETQYVVDASTTAGLRGTYSTIQTAIAAAVADGAALGNYKKIYIRTGTYTEDLTLPVGIMLVGQTFPFTGNTPITPYQSTVIVGNHTFTGSAVLAFENLNFVGVSGDLFSGGTIVVLNCGNCYFVNTADFIFNITSANSALRFYECTFSSSGQDIFNLDSNELWMRQCYFAQQGQIVQSDATVNLLNVTNIGAVKSTGGNIYLNGCTLNSNTEPYNIAGNALGTLVSCYFGTASTAAIQSTNLTALVSCQIGGTGAGNPKLLQTGIVYSNATATAGNIIQGKNVTLSGMTPYIADTSDFFIGVNNTIAGSGGQVIFGNSQPYTQGQVYIIKDITGNFLTNILEITSDTGILFDGLTSLFANINWECVQLRFNGTNFNII